MNWKRMLRKSLPFALTLGIVALLLTQIDPLTIARLLADIDPLWLMVGWGCYLATNVARALRFGALLELNRPLAILPEMLALSLFNNILPSRSGELTFPYFMHTRHRVSVGESAGALILARVFDYLAVALLFLAFGLWRWPRLDSRAAPIIAVTAGLLALSVAGLALTPWLGAWGLRGLRWLFGRWPGEERPWAARILRGAERMIFTFQQLRRGKVWLLTLFWSLLTWLGVFAWFTAFLHAMHAPYPFPMVVIGATFASLAKAIPLLTVSGFGAHEAGWALGFGLTGMPMDLAIATGFAVNLLTLFSAILFGSMALMVMAKIKPRRVATS